MARSFAGIMGLLGMVVVLLRAVKSGGSLDTTIPQAVAWTFVLSLVGAVVGTIAQRTIDESVRSKIEHELATIADSEKTT